MPEPMKPIKLNDDEIA